MNLFILNHPLSQSGCRACVYLLSHPLLSFCQFHLDLYNYVFIYIYLYFMYIYTVRYRSRNMSNTRGQGDRGEKSSGGTGRAGRRGERSREHGSTRLQFTTLLRSMQQEVRSSTLTQARHLATCWSGRHAEILTSIEAADQQPQQHTCRIIVQNVAQNPPHPPPTHPLARDHFQISG